MGNRIVTAKSLPKDMMRMECAVLLRPGSVLRTRLLNDQGCTGWCGPVWGIYKLDRCFSPAHTLRFGDGSWITPTREDLDDLILLGQIGTRELSELFP